jgi:tetratricopeptide (TPR) repeat protein
MRTAWLPILLLYLASPALAATPEDTLRQANTAYAQAQEASRREERLAGFLQAQRLFEHAAAQGVRSAELYTNLGNAALQAERLGPAILAYQRALALEPNHGRARQNLRHARTLLPAWVPRPEPAGTLESFFFWRDLLNPAEQAAIAAFAFLLAAVLLAVAIRWRSPLARNLASMPLLAWLGLLASAAIEAHTGETAQAVLVADETIARAADSSNSPARFAEPLPSGTEVQILESRERWVHIVLANGRDAWVARGAVEQREVDF